MNAHIHLASLAAAAILFVVLALPVLELGARIVAV